MDCPVVVPTPLALRGGRVDAVNVAEVFSSNDGVSGLTKLTDSHLYLSCQEPSLQLLELLLARHHDLLISNPQDTGHIG